MEFLMFYKGSYRKCHFGTRKGYIDLIFISSTLLLVSLCSSSASAKLTLAKQCGEIVCKVHHYCARIDDSCRPCQETCDKALSNYDQNLCEKDCQDYLHDLFYMRKSLKNESDHEDANFLLFYTDILNELETLKILLLLVIFIITVVMIAVVALFIYIKRSRNRLGISSSSWCGGKKDDIMDLPVIFSNSRCVTLPRKPESTSIFNNNRNNNMNMSRVSTPDVVSRSGSEAAIPVSILAVNKLPFVDPLNIKPQKFRREPSESTLPDYQGYDNPALVPSPTRM